jgi:hypothetical protein
MNFEKSKTKTILATFLVLTFALTLVALPVANAHTPAWTLPTHSFVTAFPSPIGAGQQAIVVFWVDKTPPTANGAYGDRWDGWTVEVTKPDGNTETLGPFTSDPVGGGYTLYTPDQVGTYKFVSKFPEQTAELGPVSPSGWRPGATDWVNDTYLASTSDPDYITVQQEPIQQYPDTPLLDQFWARPMYSVNRAWAPLGGNWLAGAAQNVNATTSFGYGPGPESAHIMWATPIWAGGIMDARFGDIGYQTVHYEGITFSPPIIIDGRIYYNTPSFPMYGWNCVDLYTGQEIWFHNSTGPIQYGGNADTAGMNVSRYPMLSFGQILDFESPNQHGGFPYLWSTYHPNYTAPYVYPADQDVWQMYDAVTGNWLLNIDHAPTTGTAVYGQDGSILRYNIVNLGNATVPKLYLTVWNTTAAILYRTPEQYAQVASATTYWLWRPVTGATFDGRNGYSLNVSIPAVQGSILAVREGQYVIGGTLGTNSWDNVVVPGNLWALSLKLGQEGTLLWNITFTSPPFPQRSVTSQTFARLTAVIDPEDDVFIFTDSTTRRVWCYNLADGSLKWGPTAPGPAFDYYGMGNLVYQGKFFTYGYAGVLNAYDIQTGNLLWNYTANGIGFEVPYGNYPLSLACVADGKLYMYDTEHSPSTPLWRGSSLRCINASNGAELWKISHWGPAVVSDGFLVGLDYYDNRVYCYGKGPSATTVEAPMTAITAGDSVVIQGTVIDTAAGTKQSEQSARFPNGVPVVSDDSMSAWMEYVYKQQAMPTNATGVQVTIDAVDPNGNFIHIGTATSDTSGLFHYAWKTPDIPGEYAIIATFAGSESYYASYKETAMVVSEAPAATPTPTPLTLPPYETYTIGAVVVLLIAIAIVGILLLRKK